MCLGIPAGDNVCLDIPAGDNVCPGIPAGDNVCLDIPAGDNVCPCIPAGENMCPGIPAGVSMSRHSPSQDGTSSFKSAVPRYTKTHQLAQFSHFTKRPQSRVICYCTRPNGGRHLAERSRPRLEFRAYVGNA